MLIQPPTHDEGGFQQGYCVPAALSALTGMTAEAAGRILAAEVMGRRPEEVKGVRIHELLAALRHLGYDYSVQSFGHLEQRPMRRRGWWGRLVSEDYVEGRFELRRVGRPTLARWLRERDSATQDAPCLLSLSGVHLVVVQGEDVADNIQGMVPTERSRYLRRRVARVVRIEGRTPAAGRQAS